jgi:hypothetical protein
MIVLQIHMLLTTTHHHQDIVAIIGNVYAKQKHVPVKLNDKNHKHYSKDVVLTGTQYEVKSSHGVNRRRRLLKYHASGC